MGLFRLAAAREYHCLCVHLLLSGGSSWVYVRIYQLKALFLSLYLQSELDHSAELVRTLHGVVLVVMVLVLREVVGDRAFLHAELLPGCRRIH